MSAAIAHRGPDGEGVYFDRDPDDVDSRITPERPQVALAFRRLAVIDPTPCSDQPFVSTDGRYVLVFNGEIYNFREVRAELAALHPNYSWRSNGDTEALMQSVAAWGEGCVERFNGMFAFAVWDHHERSLLLARDRMGQKPLYVGISPGAGIVFGSELGALQQHPAMRREPSSPSSSSSSIDLSCYLRYGTTPVNLVLPHVYALPPSFVGTLRYGSDINEGAPGDRVGRQYFSASGSDRAATRVVSVPDVREAVERAVQRQLVADVPLGVFLSGGIDSSVIAACARKHGPVRTFSIGFDDPRYDESSYARQVAEHLGTDHHEFHVTPRVIDDLPRLAAVFGEPFADSSSLPTHYLSRETRKHVTVALSGDGGDELFGGYDRYRAMKWSQRLRGLEILSPLGKWVARRGHPKSKLARVGRFAASLALPPSQRYDSYMRIFTDARIRRLMLADLQPTHLLAHLFKPELRRTNNVVRAALATDRLTYLPNDLLTKVDRCSMLHGLEVRSPFMDHELVELAAQLTEDQLLKGGKKRMLREAFARDLPDFVFKRPKMGFAVPIGEWFRGPLRAFLRDHLFASDSFAREHFRMPIVERLVEEHETQRRDHGQRLYALLMLELWWKLQRSP